MRRVGRWSRLAGLRRRTVALFGGLLLLGAIAGGVAWAAIPDGDGVIHGCYLKSGGTLRVIDASVTNCKKTETAIWWNRSGPPGDAGPQGEQGPPGPGGAMVHQSFCGGSGCPDALLLEQGAEPTEILSLDLSTLEGDPWTWSSVAAFGSLELSNAGSESAPLTCDLGSEDWNFSVPANDPELAGNEDLVTVSFVSPAGYDPSDPGTSVLRLLCQANEWGDPGGIAHVRLTGATLTVYPLSFLSYGED